MIITKLKKHSFSIVLFFTFIILVVISELVYTINNKPISITHPFANVLFDITNIYLEIGDYEKASNSIENSAKIYIHTSKIDFPGKIPKYHPQIELEKLDSETKKEVKQVISDMQSKFKNTNPSLLSNTLYHIGLILYDKGYFDEANKQFQTSVYLTPALSFLHIELANSYFQVGQIDKGKEALNYCRQFFQSANHCKDYEENNVNTNFYFPVGAYEEEIDKFLLEKSI